jgi:uncharacterized protein YqgC (DUF456 family)
MDWSLAGAALLFALLGIACLVLVPLGLPGLWILIALAAAAQLLGTPLHFGWTLLGIAIAIGVAAEIAEAVAGAAGAKYGGATRRGMIGAFAGGIVGAIFLTGLVPIPIVGTLFGGLLGSFGGAWLGEASAEHQRHPNEKFRAALGAAAGKLAGTFGKLVAGVAIWVLLVYGAITT